MAEVKAFGRSVAAPPSQLPVLPEHKGSKSDSSSWKRGKKKYLVRRLARQRLTANHSEPGLKELAATPQRRGK